MIDIKGNRYIAGEPSAALQFDDAPERITIFHVDVDTVTHQWVEHNLAEFESDDVFNESFLKGALFVSKGHSTDINPRAREILKARGCVWVKAIGLDTISFAPGPHLVTNGIFSPALKLYDDTHSAFLHAIRRGPEGEFVETEYAGWDCLRTLSIAVPSRAGLTPTAELPLKGYRIAVKDIFEIENVRTSVCNRAYYELYGPPQKTAVCVELLLEAGATVVGTTKLASFAATEEPVECIDYSAPWNPRADRYQSPAGSSSGSGAAMAAYEWLDITIGSDSEYLPDWCLFTVN